MRKIFASARTWGVTKGCEEIDFCIGDADVMSMIAEHLEEKATFAIKNGDYDLAKELITELADLRDAMLVAFAKPDENAESKEETEGAEE